MIQDIRLLWKHILLIPFHFPPIQGSTGALRSVAFSRWLPESGWRVSVLTVPPRAYPNVATQNLRMIPEDTKVVRAFALDSQRHLSVRGRYLRSLALPDRWSTWIVGGVLAGLRLCREDRPDVLYSTYPTPSSHVIGWLLHRLTGIPWVAEFRDPMVEEGYPAVRIERDLRRWIERKVLRNASRVVVVTESARRLYCKRADRGSDFVVNVPNGFDEDPAGRRPDPPSCRTESRNKPLVVLHSGVLYPAERNPRPLLEALSQLAKESLLDHTLFVFRGAGNETKWRQSADELGLKDVVEFRDQISYAAAVEEMRNADALMVLQGAACNRQIPAKVYEYLATGKPVLCLADPRGDTAALFNSLGLGEPTALEDTHGLQTAVRRFLDQIEAGSIKVADRAAIEGMSRRAQTGKLAIVLDSVLKMVDGATI